MQKEQGFTLIELIIVIIILGVLAVTAAPRFFDFKSDARKSSLNGLKASMESAAKMIHARAAIAGKLDTIIADNESVEGVKLVYGYPMATPEGILAAVNAEAKTLLSEGGEWVYHHDPGVIYITLASYKKEGTAIQAVDCYAFYVAAESVEGSPRIGTRLNNC